MADLTAPERVLRRRLQTYSKTGLNELQEHELKLLALEMRRDRFSVQRISRELSLDPKKIADWIKEELAEVIKLERLTAQEIVRLELEELDFLQSSLIEDIQLGEPQAILAALKIAESRRKLLGLDQPDAVKQELVIREIEGINPDTDL